MAFTFHEKLSRILRFLSASHDPHIYALLARRGYDTAARQEGWDLFNLAAGARLEYDFDPAEIMPASESKRCFEDLDDIENTWFPVVDATLARRFPELHSQVFLNLAQTRGPEVLVTVGTLLDRVESLPETEDGKAAFALLEQRGFDAEVRGAAHALIDKVQSVGEPTLPTVDPDAKAAQKQGLEEAWAWFREWSTIARTVVHRGDLRLRLGLSQPKTASSAPADAEPEE